MYIFILNKLSNAKISSLLIILDNIPFLSIIKFTLFLIASVLETNSYTFDSTGGLKS